MNMVGEELQLTNVHKAMESTEETKVPAITQTDAESILKGVRPEGMDFLVFRNYRKIMKQTIKEKLRGELFFRSVGYNKKGEFVKATYVKPKENK